MITLKYTSLRRKKNMLESKNAPDESNTEGLHDLAALTCLSHYSRVDSGGKRLETWDASVDRVMDTHVLQAERIILGKDRDQRLNQVMEMLDSARAAMKKKLVFPSGRSLQFAEPDLNAGILKNPVKLYNCSATSGSDHDIFHEIIFMLLCGTGVGISLQKHHVKMMAPITAIAKDTENIVHVVHDSIEGWADALRCLIYTYFPPRKPIDVGPLSDPAYDDARNQVKRNHHLFGKKIVFDYSKVRKKELQLGSFLAKHPARTPYVSPSKRYAVSLTRRNPHR